MTAHAAPARPPWRRPRAGSPERTLKFLAIDFGTTMSAASMTVERGPQDGEGDDSAGLYELPKITLWSSTGSGKTLTFAVLLRSLLDNAWDQAVDAAWERAAAARDRAVVMPQAPAWRLYWAPRFADRLADYRNRAPEWDRAPVYLQRVSARAIPGPAFSSVPESYPRRADDLLARWWWRRDLAARIAAGNRGQLADADLAARASGYAGRRHSRALQLSVLRRIAAEAAFPMTELLASDLVAQGLAPGATVGTAGVGLWALDASGHLRVPGSYAVHACGHVRAAIATWQPRDLFSQGDEQEAGRVMPMTRDTVRLWLADSGTGRACLLVAALADPGQVMPVAGRPRPGGSDGDDEFMAGLLIRMWTLASGRTLPSGIRPEQLSAEELIRFWADDLQDAFQRRRAHQRDRELPASGRPIRHDPARG